MLKNPERRRIKPDLWAATLEITRRCYYLLERYKWRHDSILNYLHDIISNNVHQDYTIYTDLPAPFRGVSTLPFDVALTTLRPYSLRAKYPTYRQADVIVQEYSKNNPGTLTSEYDTSSITKEELVSNQLSRFGKRT